MSAFLTIAVIHILGAMSPGPDFVLTIRNSLMFERRAGVLTAVGFGLGVLLHCSYSILGIGVIISQSILLFNTIKYIGAAYLLFIGWKALTHKKEAIERENLRQNTQAMSNLQALRMGFLCNALNPKVTLFILSLFTQVIDPHTPIALLWFYSAYMACATIVWFSFVATVLSHQTIRQLFMKIQSAFERTMGAVLIALGLKVAFATND